MEQFSRNLAQDNAFYVAIASFVLLAFGGAVALGDLSWFIPGVYFFNWTRIIPGVLVMTFLVFAIQALKAERPLANLAQRIRDFVSLRTSGFLLFTCIAIFHGAFTSLKSMLPELQPFVFDPLFAGLDETLHGQAPWLYLRGLNGISGTIRLLYSEIWFLLTIGTTLAMCLSLPSRLRSQYLWTFLLCWTVLGIVVAACFMSAGPIYYDRLLHADRFAGLAAHIESMVSPDIPSTQYPDILWKAYVMRSPGMGTGISAFPSLHLAMATLFALTAFRLRKPLGWLMTGYAAIILVGSVHLGWHYAVDGYFSIVATILIWKLVGRRLAARAALTSARAIPAGVAY